MTMPLTLGVPLGFAVAMDPRGLPVEDRRRQQHRDDRLWRRELERATTYNLKRLHCPCCRCKGRVQCSLARVKDHLINNGREPAFRVWRGPGERDSSDEDWEEEYRRPSVTSDGQFDIGLDMPGMVEDAFTQRDEQRVPVQALESQLGDIVTEAFNIVDELENVLDDDDDDGVDDEPMGANDRGIPEESGNDDPRMLEEAMEELYHGARSSVLASTILIMTLCTIHGVSNKFADSLFCLFRNHLLPSENILPKNYYAAKALIQKLGLTYNTIHACQGGCVLYRGQYKDATVCPRCNKPRYKDNIKKKKTMENP
jgi:hypothetical protein